MFTSTFINTITAELKRYITIPPNPDNILKLTEPFSAFCGSSVEYGDSTYTIGRIVFYSDGVFGMSNSPLQFRQNAVVVIDDYVWDFVNKIYGEPAEQYFKRYTVPLHIAHKVSSYARTYNLDAALHALNC